MYIFIYFTLLLFKKYDKNKLHEELQNWEGSTILKRLVVQPRSRGQALVGVQGVELPEPFRFTPY